MASSGIRNSSKMNCVASILLYEIIYASDCAIEGMVRGLGIKVKAGAWIYAF